EDEAISTDAEVAVADLHGQPPPHLVRDVEGTGLGYNKVVAGAVHLPEGQWVGNVHVALWYGCVSGSHNSADGAIEVAAVAPFNARSILREPVRLHTHQPVRRKLRALDRLRLGALAIEDGECLLVPDGAQRAECAPVAL